MTHQGHTYTANHFSWIMNFVVAYIPEYRAKSNTHMSKTFVVFMVCCIAGLFRVILSYLTYV